MIGVVFHHLTQGGKGNNSQVKAMNSNQGIILIKPSKDIQS